MAETCTICFETKNLKACSGCSSTAGSPKYCCRECQRQDWKTHKKVCSQNHKKNGETAKAPDDGDEPRIIEVEDHKAAFDRIIRKYGFDKGEHPAKIADMLTNGDLGKISHKDFAKQWGIEEEEAISFLSWIQVGVSFKKESLQAAEAFNGNKNNKNRNDKKQNK